MQAKRAKTTRATGSLGAVADEVRRRVDIVDVVSQYVALRPAGRSFKGLCPFHSEKTPSFTVSAERQLFYCFGCGAGGNVFTFVMRIEGVNFPEAVARLAERAGMAREVAQALAPAGADLGRLQRAARLLEVHQQAAEWFARILWEGPAGEAARRYLGRRGISGETARVFRLGYAPEGWHELELALRRLGTGREVLVEAGLVVRRDDGKAYDRFRGRLMFPITDGGGRVVAFGGRILGGDEGPKYLNSPESPIYRKSEVLYGLDRAREAIRRSGRVVVVEGYMDVLAMHQFGLTDTVATCGTSLTELHGRVLARFGRQVVVAFDSDAAGQSGALRGLRQLRATGLDVRVAVLPAPHDPDSLLREHGREAMEAVLAGALGVYQFSLQQALAGVDLSSPAGKAAGVANAVAILAEVTSLVEREALLAELAARVGVPVRVIRQELARWERSTGPRPHNGQVTSYTDRGARVRSPVPAIEQAVVRLLLEDPSLVERMAQGGLSREDFSEPALGELFEALLAQGEVALADPDLAEVASQVAASGEAMQGVATAPDTVEAYVGGLRAAGWGRALAALEQEVARLEVDQGLSAEGRLERLAGIVVSYREVWERLRQAGIV